MSPFAVLPSLRAFMATRTSSSETVAASRLLQPKEAHCYSVYNQIFQYVQVSSRIWLICYQHQDCANPSNCRLPIKVWPPNGGTMKRSVQTYRLAFAVTGVALVVRDLSFPGGLGILPLGPRDLCEHACMLEFSCQGR